MQRYPNYRMPFIFPVSKKYAKCESGKLIGKESQILEVNRYAFDMS